MGKILLWLQECIKLWTKPATSVLIIGTLSDLTRSRIDLIAIANNRCVLYTQRNDEILNFELIF
jgi:hypothetical protein